MATRVIRFDPAKNRLLAAETLALAMHLLSLVLLQPLQRLNSVSLRAFLFSRPFLASFVLCHMPYQTQWSSNTHDWLPKTGMFDAAGRSTAMWPGSVAGWPRQAGLPSATALVEDGRLTGARHQMTRSPGSTRWTELYAAQVSGGAD